MERSKELLMASKRPVGTPLLEIHEALGNAPVNDRLGGKRNLPPFDPGFEPVTDFDAGLLVQRKYRRRETKALATRLEWALCG